MFTALRPGPQTRFPCAAHVGAPSPRAAPPALCTPHARPGPAGALSLSGKVNTISSEQTHTPLRRLREAPGLIRFSSFPACPGPITP